MAVAQSPRMWFRVAVAVALCGVGVLTLMMIGALNTGMGGLIAGMVLAAIPVPFYVALALSVDRYEKEPLWMLGMAFLWGATGAVFIASILNSINSSFFGAVGGADAAAFGGSVISAPVVEETAKALALLFFFIWKKNEFEGVLDGVVYGAMIGLGFAMTENVSYYSQAMANGALAGTVFVRGILAPFSHPLFAAMTGVGLGIVRETTKRGLKLIAPLIGLATAMGLHALWNLSAGVGGSLLRVYLTAIMPAILALVGIVLYAQGRERQIIRAHLTPYVQAGYLSPAEQKALSKFGGRIRTLWTAMRVHGVGGYRSEARFQQAATKLALHHWRTERGLPHDGVKCVELEAEYLRVLAESRAPGPLAYA
jgi:RsiW-degrading membrane proteinase PrsW (M82 family)